MSKILDLSILNWRQALKRHEAVVEEAVEPSPGPPERLAGPPGRALVTLPVVLMVLEVSPGREAPGKKPQVLRTPLGSENPPWVPRTPPWVLRTLAPYWWPLWGAA